MPSNAVTPITRPRPGRSLLASAARITSAHLQGRYRVASESWQNDAWTSFDEVGEQRFLATTLANRMGQAKLYVGRIDPDNPSDTPEPVDDPAINGVLDAIGAGSSGLSQIVTRLGVNLFVAGDGWLVGVPKDRLPRTDVQAARPDDTGGGPLSSSTPDLADLNITDLAWRALSVNEVSSNATGELVLHLGDTADQSVMVSPDEVFLIRVWRPHPARWWEADSPTRSNLPVLRELIGLTMHIGAQLDSRLAGPGVQIVPQSATRALREAAGLPSDPTDGDDEDPFTESLMDAMMTPISDRASASAVVPLVVTVPDDVADSDHWPHLTYSTPLDSEAREMRDEAIRRLALGADAPPELLLGTAGASHWGAWLVAEDVITTHVAPPLALICDAITGQYLRPVLEQQGMTEAEASRYVVWYDVSAMIIRPNRAADALSLYQAGVVSAETARTAAGFDEGDSPEQEVEDAEDTTGGGGLSLEQLAGQRALELAAVTPALLTMPGLEELAKQILAIMDGSYTDNSTTPPDEQDDNNSTPPAAPSTPEPPADPGLPDTADDPAPAIAGG